MSWCPRATRVAVLVNPAKATNAETHVERVEAAARAMGLQIQVVNASTSGEIDAAFATFVRERPDALFVSGGPFFLSRRVQLAHAGGAPRDPRDIRVARVCRSRRTDELRSEPDGCASSGRRLCRPHPQGRKAGRLAGRAVDQVRAGHQPLSARVLGLTCRRRCSPSPTR